ncbi:MAG: penicillin-binding protein [Fuerstiella sp.]
MTSPATERRARPFRWRSRLISLTVMLCWGVLIARLIHLQGNQREQLHESVDRQSTFTESVPARPGEILDRNGHVLAMTVTRDSLYAVPSQIEDTTDFVWKVSSVLPVDATALHERLTRHHKRQFLWIRRRLTDDQSAAIRNVGLNATTYGFRQEYLRQYPQGRAAAHVLGMRDVDNVGHGGLEQSLNELIRGVDGTRVMTRDARLKVVEVEAQRSETPQHGRTVITTIDLLTQIHAEDLLDQLMERWQPQGACAVVMDPHTGEVLAMASAPGFNPNQPGDVAEDAWKNLAVSAVFEPGSTFKPFVVAWAMQQQKLHREEWIQCFNGVYRMGRRLLHDHHPYPKLSVEDVLVKSSNIGMARIAERIGLEELYRATASFGFGRRTGIELPGEVRGLVRPLERWDEYSMGSIPMGQELAVTPLQLITGHAALANGGRLVRPHLLLDASSESIVPGPLDDIETVEATPEIEADLIDREITDWIVRHPMKGVVERGTGKSAKTEGLSLFGKTGTAQKIEPDTGRYSNTRHVCSFICGAPAENPQLLVLVMVDEPTAEGLHYGGTVAAPTAAKLLQFAIDRLPQMSGRMTVRPEHDLPVRFQ